MIEQSIKERLNEAIELKPGGCYVIEYPGFMSMNVKERMLKYVNLAFEDKDIKFIILDAGAKVARPDIVVNVQ
jgi:hypothetical protein